MARILSSRMDPLELESEVESAGDGNRAEEILQQEGLVGGYGENKVHKYVARCVFLNVRVRGCLWDCCLFSAAGSHTYHSEGSAP